MQRNHLAGTVVSELLRFIERQRLVAVINQDYKAMKQIDAENTSNGPAFTRLQLPKRDDGDGLLLHFSGSHAEHDIFCDRDFYPRFAVAGKLCLTGVLQAN